MLCFRVEYTLLEEHLSPWPITTRLFVRVNHRADVERIADELFTQVYGIAPAKLGFGLSRTQSAE